MWKQAECGKCGELFTYRQQAMCPNCGASANFFLEPLNPDTSSLDGSELQNCEGCGYEIPGTAKFCPSCGFSIKKKAEVFFCVECGKKNPKSLKKCKHCGESQATYRAPESVECTHAEFSPGRTPDGTRICKQCKARVGDSNAIESLQIAINSVKEVTNTGKYLWGGAAILLIGLILVFASKGNSSYKIGYQAGKELSANNSFFYISGQPINICDMVLNQSLAGTPNDNIDWSGVKKDDFDRGCLDAYAHTHDGMRIKTTETTPKDSAPASTGASTPASPSAGHAEPMGIGAHLTATGATIFWVAPRDATGITNYNVEIQANGGTWKLISTVPASQLSMDITIGDTAGWSSFRVSSVYSDGTVVGGKEFGLSGQYA